MPTLRNPQPGFQDQVCRWDEQMIEQCFQQSATAEQRDRISSSSQGRSRPAALREFLFLLDSHARARLTPEQLKLGRYCKALSDSARRSAQEGMTVETCSAFAIARRLVDTRQSSEEPRFFCLAEIEPAESYAERCNGDYARARHYLERALAADELLEDAYGYIWKIGHRIHLLVAAAELELQFGRPERAAQGVFGMLSLLCGSAHLIEEAGNWDPDRLACLPAGMKEVLALQGIELLFLVVAGISDPRDRRVLGDLLGESVATRVGSLFNNGASLFDDSHVSLCVDVLTVCCSPRSAEALHPYASTIAGFSRPIRTAIAFHQACLDAENGLGSIGNAKVRFDSSSDRPWFQPVLRQWRARLCAADQRKAACDLLDVMT